MARRTKKPGTSPEAQGDSQMARRTKKPAASPAVELEKALGIKFANPSLLEQALIHSSFISENAGLPSACNERLEFLGDAFLGYVVAESLHAVTPPLSEGTMTRLRSALVRGEALASIAQALDLGRHLVLGRGEERSGGRKRPTTLSCTLEAIVGAYLVDQGIGPAREFVHRLLGRQWEALLNAGLPPDYKSRLQEVVQRRGKPPPRYKVLEAQGPAHSRRFVVEVWAGDKALGRGEGRRKKDAEQEAARKALEALPPLP